MPRQPRIDIPGLLHHVIARGIERRRIFLCPPDYDDFLNRVCVSVGKHPSQVVAWALMPNHFHLLVRSGPQGLSPLMRSLMTGYAVAFNRRHRRAGYLFQNRFKSIVCEEGAYFNELVRYIHLNPLRSGLVKTLDDLGTYPYCGHGAILGKKPCSWQDTEVVLASFGSKVGEARRRYKAFVAEGVSQGRRPDLTGGGLRRSLGIGPASLPSRSEKQAYDSRILGPGQFVENVLKQAEGEEAVKAKIRRDGLSLESLGQRVAEKMGVEADLLFKRGRANGLSKAKSVFIYLGVEFLERTGLEMARLVKVSPGAASRARARVASLFRPREVEDLLNVN